MELVPDRSCCFWDPSIEIDGHSAGVLLNGWFYLYGTEQHSSHQLLNWIDANHPSDGTWINSKATLSNVLNSQGFELWTAASWQRLCVCVLWYSCSDSGRSLQVIHHSWYGSWLVEMLYFRIYHNPNPEASTKLKTDSDWPRDTRR